MTKLPLALAIGFGIFGAAILIHGILAASFGVSLLGLLMVANAIVQLLEEW